MKRSLKSIGAFAQQNEALNTQNMAAVAGGKDCLDREIRVSYNTSLLDEGDNTDCMDLYTDGSRTACYW